MKYLKLFEWHKYTEPDDFGESNYIYNVNDDYIIKMPKDTTEKGLNNFNDHIHIMKSYPDIFPDVKRLDKFRASIEKLDIETAKNEYRDVWYYMYNYIPSRIEENDIMLFLLQNSKYLKILKESEDDMFIKWYNFLKKIQSTLFIIDPYLDLHNRNFGIDKEGKIKLIDF